MRYFTFLSRLLGGLVFIFSGFVKGVDPVGSQIKFGDYLTAAGINLPDNILLIAAMILCATEFLIGVSLLTGYFYRAGVILYFLFMVLFTPLTFILAIYNPVSDCGCFGDAIVLTNWETFYKNLFLMAFGIILLLTRKKIRPDIAEISSLSVIVPIALLFVVFMIYNVRHLPIIDFRPYKTGVNIRESMAVPADAPHDKYHITLIYEKDGQQIEFSLSDYPADDTTWKFIDQKSILISKGYEPPVRDFLISNTDGQDITDLILYDPGYSLLMISQNLGKADPEDLDRGFIRGFNSLQNNISFYVLTSSTSDEIARFQNGLRFCTGDATLLKTIVRSNPGYLLLKDGAIIAKWAPSDMPREEWFGTDMTASSIKRGSTARSVVAVFLVSFSIIFIYMAGSRIGCKLDNRKKQKQ